MSAEQHACALAAAILADPDGRHFGYELSRAADVRPGRMYPILRAWLDAGLLADGWEKAQPAELLRPPRRYYTLTEAGRRYLHTLCGHGHP